jgi:cation diffusion facilitator CzcD-associated flavoprotein CzcO
MASTPQVTQSIPTISPSTGAAAEFDAIIIGAGVSGLCQLYHLRQLGLKVRLFEEGGGIGGTWYWNRYPGCRFDSESYTYGYFFSEELLQEWDWREHFSAQPDTERYLNFVADKFDLRCDIEFNTRVSSAVFNDQQNYWDIRTKQGSCARARYLVAAVGILSAPYTPPFAGLDSFRGERYHTGRWPQEQPNLAGKRVAVIGTGASAVQLIPEIAKVVGHLTVFQRRPNYCAPLRNALIDPETQKKIKANYPEIVRRTRETTAAFLHDFDPRSIYDVTPQERLARFEELWAQPGFAKWLGNFHDINTDPKANEIYAEFVRNKIRERVKDPIVAEKLVPKDHPFGAKRIPLETGYYEAYNRDNVSLVDLHETPIERITPKGIKTTEREYEFDVIIFATGFDAVTGALTKIDIRGTGGESISESWAHGPRTYLGLQTAGFPNLFIISAAAFCNLPRCVEMLVEWVTESIRYMREQGFTRIEATPEAEEGWVRHSAELAGHSFLTRGDVGGDSWFLGANIPGKERVFLLYANGAPEYRKECAEVAANGYRGFELR